MFRSGFSWPFHAFSRRKGFHVFVIFVIFVFFRVFRASPDFHDFRGFRDFHVPQVSKDHLFHEATTRSITETEN